MSAIGVHDDDDEPPSPPLHLLEVTVISAQDLHRRQLGRRVRAYAVAWTDGAARKLRTDVDLAGGADPTWNDRFLFRVDAAFLRSGTAAVAVEVRAKRRLGPDAVLGRTRIVVSTFVRPSPKSAATAAPSGRQVAALMLRRPRSLRPQGMVNVAVALLGAAQARAVAPVYCAPGSPDAFAVKDLVAMRPALGRIAEEDLDQGRRPQKQLVEYSGPLDPRRAAVEQSKLAMKLEKWRADLSPDRMDKDGHGGGRRRRGRTSCFFGGGAEWER